MRLQRLYCSLFSNMHDSMNLALKLSCFNSFTSSKHIWDETCILLKENLEKLNSCGQIYQDFANYSSKFNFYVIRDVDKHLFVLRKLQGLCTL